MNRKTFTKEQQRLLRQNPYIYSVTENRISLTSKFKEIFIKAYEAGVTPRQIFEEHGFDINIFGERRVWSFTHLIRKEYEKYGKFTQGYKDRRTSTGNAESKQLLAQGEQISRLTQKVNYLEQEIEFIKKISSIRNSRK